ncbi:MAG: LysE family transporter [Candidatus Competibacteraceae bacterium]
MALAQSRFFALLTVSGISTGTALWGFAGFFGITVLFAAAPWLFLVIKLLGGIYLLYLGFKLIASSFQSLRNTPMPTVRGLRPFSAWRLGLVTNLANPKTAVFVSSLFAAVLPPSPSVELGLMSVALMTTLSLAWYALVACLFSTPRFSELYRRGRRWVDRTAGAVFMGFGAHLTPFTLTRRLIDTHSGVV